METVLTIMFIIALCLMFMMLFIACMTAMIHALTELVPEIIRNIKNWKTK